MKKTIYTLLCLLIALIIIVYPVINDKNKFRLTLITKGNINKFIIFLLLIFLVLENYLLAILVVILFFIVEQNNSYEGFINYYSS